MFRGGRGGVRSGDGGGEGVRKQRSVDRHVATGAEAHKVADWKGVGLARVARQGRGVRALGQQKSAGLLRRFRRRGPTPKAIRKHGGIPRGQSLPTRA